MHGDDNDKKITTTTTMILIITTMPYDTNTAHVECKNKSDASNNWGNWNHLKIIQKIPEQHTGTA
jgi:hypothetical protein